MKKILFLILFLTGLFPFFNNNGLHLGSFRCYGQESSLGEETVYVCDNDVDSSITQIDSYSYVLTICVWDNEGGVATNPCVRDCSTEIVSNDPCDYGSPSYNEEECNSNNNSCEGITCSYGYVLTEDCNCEEEVQPCPNTCGEGYYQDSNCDCVALPPPPCSTSCPSGYELVNCNCLPQSKDCNGVVGGSAYTASCGCIGGTTGFTSCPTGCDDAKQSNIVIQNSIISNQNNLIQSSTNTYQKEYGVEQNLTTFPPGTTPVYKNITVRTDNSSNSFTPNFTWDSTNGYTIGVSHGHPLGGAPSPADLIYAYGKLNDPNLVAGGQVAIDYFKANFSITVVATKNGITDTYVVKIKDWTALATLYNTYKSNPSAANTAWQNEGSAYMQANSSASYGEVTSYASVKLYGNAVTILKKDSGTTKLVPLKIDSSNNKIVKNPCPN